MPPLSELALRHSKLILFVVVVCMIAGAMRYFTMPSREDPYLTIRSSVVVAQHPGLSAERMEQLVARPLEEQIITVPEIEEILTTVLEGRVIIQANAYFEADNLDRVWDELAEAVEAARPDLPPTMGSIVVDDDFGDVAVLTAALTGADYSMEELFNYAEYARNRFLSVPGTRRVEIIGAPDRRVYLSVDNAAMTAAGLTLNDIRSALDARAVTLPAGEVLLEERRYLLEPSGLLQTAEDLRTVLIRPSNPAFSGQPVALSQIATITDGIAEPPNQIAYYNGRPALVISVVQEPNVSAINYGERALARLDEVQSELPIGIDFSAITVQAEQVRSAVFGVSRSVIQTLVVVSLCVVIFLGLRTGLVVGSIVPVVVLLTILGMSVWGIPLQRMSLATIVISLGLLVDNGIVIAEDFRRRLGEDIDRREAVAQTGKELALPLLSSSLTTMIFFLPLALAANESSEYTRSISQVIVLSLSISWLVAMLVTPILCFRFVNPPRASQGKQSRLVQRGFDRLEQGYANVLRFILRGRIIFLGLIVLSFFGGGYLMSQVPAQFFPSSDREQVLVYLDLPEGVSAEQTDDAMQIVLDTIADKDMFPDFRDAAGYVGFGGPRFVLSLQPVDPGPNVGFAVVNIDGLDNVQTHVGELQNALERRLPDAMIRVTKMFLGPTDPNVIQLQVKGPDAAHINQMADRVEAALMEFEGANYAWTDWYNPTTKLVLDIDEDRAQLLGLTSAGIAQQVALLTQGQTVSNLYRGDEKVPVILRLNDAQRRSVDYLESLTLYAPNSLDPIRLGTVATLRPEGQWGRIAREDLTRTVTIEASNLETSPEDLVPMLQDTLSDLRADLLPGHSIELAGAVGDSAEAQGALGALAPLALGMIFVLLLAQFGSFRNVVIILMILPLSIIGASIGLTVMGAPFGFMVILGLFALFGIIVNNAIVLIDRINIEVAASQDEEDDDPTHDTKADNRMEAILSASTRRLRPILITTVTTILGLLPLIIGKDVLFFGLANVVAWGLAVGTILTLGVVPVLYSLFFRVDVSQKAEIDKATKNDNPEAQTA